MKQNTLIGHKETVIICEESGLVSLNYNVLLTTLEVSVVVKPVIIVVIVKSTSTCIKCDRTCHTFEIVITRR
jgi:hypothetical protein